jgi:hypothetical protein
MPAGGRSLSQTSYPHDHPQLMGTSTFGTGDSEEKIRKNRDLRTPKVFLSYWLFFDQKPEKLDLHGLQR